MEGITKVNAWFKNIIDTEKTASQLSLKYM